MLRTRCRRLQLQPCTSVIGEYSEMFFKAAASVKCQTFWHVVNFWFTCQCIYSPSSLLWLLHVVDLVGRITHCLNFSVLTNHFLCGKVFPPVIVQPLEIYFVCSAAPTLSVEGRKNRLVNWGHLVKVQDSGRQGRVWTSDESPESDTIKNCWRDTPLTSSN